MPETSIISLPPQRWREAKRLRLEALREEPAAFASSYEDELAFRDEVWRTRLTSAFERDGNLTFFAEVDGKLVGMAGAGWSSKAKLRHVAEVYSVYVSPGVRGRGIATRLCDACLKSCARWGILRKRAWTLMPSRGRRFGYTSSLALRSLAQRGGNSRWTGDITTCT